MPPRGNRADADGRPEQKPLIDQQSIVRRAKRRGVMQELPVLVDFTRPEAER